MTDVGPRGYEQVVDTVRARNRSRRFIRQRLGLGYFSSIRS